MEYYTRYTRYKTIAEMQEWDTENANDKELMHSYNSWVDQISKNKAPLSAEGHSNYAGCSGASIWNGKDTPEICSIRNKILAQLINNSCITSSI